MQDSNYTISTKRLEATDGKEDYGSANILSDLEAWIERLSAEAALIWSGGSSLDMHLMHLGEIQDIKVSDLVTDSDGSEYIVKGVQPFKGGDIPSHTEVILSKKTVKV